MFQFEIDVGDWLILVLFAAILLLGFFLLFGMFWCFGIANTVYCIQRYLQMKIMEQRLIDIIFGRRHLLKYQRLDLRSGRLLAAGLLLWNNLLNSGSHTFNYHQFNIIYIKIVNITLKFFMFFDFSNFFFK